MSTTRDHPDASDSHRPLCEGATARARYGERAVVGEIVEVREETPEVTRVVLSPYGEDVELDTDAERVEPVDPTLVCPRCHAVWERREAYRCPDCGADLVSE
jgi:Zn finger protein HypA/HybF involved in hydrogenase expression